MESLFSSNYFWDNRLKPIIKKREIQYQYLTKKINFETLLRCKLFDPFRFFRWFFNIKKYFNLKDIIYLQGISLVIDNIDKYWNFLDLLKKWVINQKYIEKNWIISEKKEEFNLEITSATYILNKYFNKKNMKTIILLTAENSKPYSFQKDYSEYYEKHRILSRYN